MASSTAARRALALEEPLVPSALPDDEATKLAVFRAAILVHGAWTGACVAQRSRGDASAAGKRVARRRASLLAPREARETARGARRLHRLLGRAAFYSAYAAWALLLLALFEKPWWCRGRPDACGAGPRANLYPNSGLSRLGPGAALAAAGALLGGLVAEAALEAVARDALADFRGAGRPLFAWRCGALALCAADAAAAFCAGGAASLTPASALCRCLLVLTHDRNVRTQLRLIARVAPDVLSVLALLGCVVLLYAWFATLIFQNETAEGREVFPTYGASVWQLFILVTTSNFPDVMQRAYAKNRATFLFFALFLVLCLWFLLNVVLAVVSDGYTTSTAAEAALAAASKRRNLDDAYDILLSLERRDGRGVSRDAMARLFGELNATASVPHLDGDAQALVFAVLDHDGSMAVDKAEFELLVDALKLRFVRVDDRPDASSLRGRVAAVVGDARFDRCVDALLVANLVFEAAYGAKSLEARSPADVDGRPDTPAQIASAGFTLVYLAELVARCVARNGVVAYLCRTSLQASFDGCATLAAVALTAYVYYPNGFSEADVIRYALLARTLRLVRVFDGVPAFHKVAAALRRVLPKAPTGVL